LTCWENEVGLGRCKQIGGSLCACVLIKHCARRHGRVHSTAECLPHIRWLKTFRKHYTISMRRSARKRFFLRMVQCKHECWHGGGGRVIAAALQSHRPGAVPPSRSHLRRRPDPSGALVLAKDDYATITSGDGSYHELHFHLASRRVSSKPRSKNSYT
jgi:hypothetical protein